jgi:hypothetical protein
MAKKTAKKTTAKVAKSTPNHNAIAVANAMSNLAAATAALQKLGLASMSAAQRQDSTGKLRLGESPALTNVLDVMDGYSGVFASLADKDGGADDGAVETDPSRASLALWNELAPLLVLVDSMRTQISDTMMTAAEAVKDVTVPAYAIIRANAASNPKLARAAAGAIAFYGQPAKQRAANAAKAAKAAKKKATTSGS